MPLGDSEMIMIGVARELTSDVEPVVKAQILSDCFRYLGALDEDKEALFDHWMEIFTAERSFGAAPRRKNR